jgi:2-iminobutanoate/2-iminopropanoate deaminase
MPESRRCAPMLTKIAEQENIRSGTAAAQFRSERERPMAIKREKIQPDGIHIVIRAGQPAYTQVVTVSGSGKMIFVAGQLARDVAGKLVGAGDMRAQIQQIGENIRICLEAAGAALADIVKTNTYVTNYEEFSKHGDMRLRYFGPATPTSTTVEVRRLADPDAMLEIEAIAVVD